MTSLAVSKRLDELTKQLNKHCYDVGMISTAKFILCGAVVKEIIEQKLIQGDEKEYFDNSTKMPYSTAMHSKNCHSVYSDVVVMGSGLEDIGVGKMIRWLPLLKDKPKEEIAKVLHEILPLRGDDIKLRYLEMKGEPSAVCDCKEWEDKIIQVCKKCHKQKAEEGKGRKKAYNLNTGRIVAREGESTG